MLIHAGDHNDLSVFLPISGFARLWQDPTQLSTPGQDTLPAEARIDLEIKTLTSSNSGSPQLFLTSRLLKAALTTQQLNNFTYDSG